MQCILSSVLPSVNCRDQSQGCYECTIHMGGCCQPSQPSQRCRTNDIEIEGVRHPFDLSAHPKWEDWEDWEGLTVVPPPQTRASIRVWCNHLHAGFSGSSTSRVQEIAFDR